MEQTYMAKAFIDVDVNSQSYIDFINKVEKDVVTLKVGADIDINKLIPKLKGVLEKHPQKIAIEADTSKIDKSLSTVKSFVGKSGAEIGKSFSDSIKSNFDGTTFDKIVRNSLKDGERMSNKTRIDFVKKLNQTVSKGFDTKTGEFKINSTNYLEIEKMAEAIQLLSIAKRDLGKTSNKDLLAELSASDKYLKVDFYKGLGDHIAQNLNSMISKVEKEQREIIGRFQKLQTEFAGALAGNNGASVSPTKDSAIIETLKKENADLQSQVKLLEKNSTRLQEAQLRLNKASAALSTSGYLQGRSKGVVNKEFSDSLRAFISEGGTLTKEHLSQNESLKGTKYYTNIDESLRIAIQGLGDDIAKSKPQSDNKDAQKQLISLIRQAAQKVADLYKQSFTGDYDELALQSAYDEFQKVGGSKKDLEAAFKNRISKQNYKEDIADFNDEMKLEYGYKDISKFLANSDKIQQEYLEQAKAANTAKEAAKNADNVLSGGLNSKYNLNKKFYTTKEQTLKDSYKPKARDTSQTSTDASTSKNVSGEITDLTTLKTLIEQVEQAVKNKTQAFKNEQTEVSAVVDSEKQDLNILEEKIGSVATKVKEISTAFETERQNILSVINSLENDISSLIMQIGSIDDRIGVLRSGISAVNNIDGGTAQTGGTFNTEVFTLIEKLNTLKINEGITAKIGQLKTILESLQGIGKIKTSSVNIKSIMGITEGYDKIFELAVALEALIPLLEKLNNVGIAKGALDGLKVSAANVNNMDKMADSLTKIGGALGEFKSEAMEALFAIKDLASQTEGLKNLSDILKSGKNVSEVKKQSENSKKSKQDAQPIDDIENKIKEVEKTWNSVKRKLSGGLISKKESSTTISQIEKIILSLEELNKLSGENKSLLSGKFDFVGNNLKSGVQSQIDSFFANNGETDPGIELKGKIKPLQDELNNLSFDSLSTDVFQRALELTSQIQEELSNASNNPAYKQASKLDRNRLNAEIGNYRSRNTAAEKDFGERLDRLQNLTKNTKLSSQEMENLRAEWKGLQAEIQQAGKMGSSFTHSLKTGFKALARYMSTFVTFYDFIRYFRQGLKIIKELDDEFTNMQKVSDESITKLRQISKESFKVAENIASTAKDIQASVADFMKLGYKADEAMQLSTDANIYANVGDMEIDEATEHMTSSIKAFNKEFINDVEASRHIIDVYNEVGNNFAITSADIGEGMERSAAALVAAGNNLHKSVALLTAGNQIQQDADTVSNALKVVSLRIRGSKSELEGMGEDTEGLALSTSKLREELKALTGVDIMLDNSTYKDTFQIMDELAEVFEDLDDITQANVLEKIAGKTRSSVVAGLIQNMDIAREVLETAENAEGSALKENERHADSISGRWDKIASKGQEFWNNFMGSNTVKFFEKIIDLLLTMENSFLNIGGAIPQFIGLWAGFKSFKGEGYFIIHSTNVKEALENHYCIS